MKIKFKKALTIIIVLFLLLMVDCCKPTKQITQTNIDYQEYSIEKLDSICLSDSISNELNLWHRIDLKDYETNLLLTKYMYIKILNDSCNLIYIIEDNKISKRLMYDK